MRTLRLTAIHNSPARAPRQTAFVQRIPIYGEEEKAQKLGLAGDALRAHRQERMRPLIEGFSRWRAAVAPTLLPTEPLMAAIRYYDNHHDAGSTEGAHRVSIAVQLAPSPRRRSAYETMRPRSSASKRFPHPRPCCLISARRLSTSCVMRAREHDCAVCVTTGSGENLPKIERRGHCAPADGFVRIEHASKRATGRGLRKCLKKRLQVLG